MSTTSLQLHSPTEPTANNIHFSGEVMAMSKLLPFLITLLLLSACKIERPGNDLPPVAPEHEPVAASSVAGVSDAELESFAKAVHLAKLLEIDPVAEPHSMKPIIESCGLTMERFREIQSEVDQSARLQRKNDELMKKLRD